MILKVDALASLVILLSFLILSYPLLFGTYDLSGLERLRTKCHATFESMKDMQSIIRPTGNPALIKLYDEGATLDVLHVNGTLEWSVSIKCAG